MLCGVQIYGLRPFLCFFPPPIVHIKIKLKLYVNLKRIRCIHAAAAAVYCTRDTRFVANYNLHRRQYNKS